MELSEQKNNDRSTAVPLNGQDIVGFEASGTSPPLCRPREEKNGGGR